MTTIVTTWVIEPRDPLVFGSGLPTTAFAAHGTPLPPPSTVAGMVRASFVSAESSVSPTRADELLEQIAIRGPWLRGPLASQPRQNRVVWVPAPHDGVRAGDEFLRGAVTTLADDEGVLWPGAVPPDFKLLELPERGRTGSKTAPIAAATPLWPIEAAVCWALGEPVAPMDVAAPGRGTEPGEAFGREHRVHLAIDNTRGTALPGALFGSAGTRFERDFELAVEVTVRAATAAVPPRTVVLGGESRLSFRREDPNAAFPDFERYAPRYKEALTRGPRGLRLQLLTPACVRTKDVPGAWAWLPSEPLEGLKLVAACIPSFTAISGWDLQAAAGRGAPRAVRRLVPAGSVYYYEIAALDGTSREDALLAACRTLWGRPIDNDDTRTPNDRRHHLAAPGRDGFGLMLPGFWFDGGCS